MRFSFYYSAVFLFYEILYSRVILLFSVYRVFYKIRKVSTVVLFLLYECIVVNLRG